MVIVLDENVSLGLAAPLRQHGHEVLAIAEMADRSMSDDEVWRLTVKHRALLITRDYHFTNHVRFRTEEVQAVIYLRRGNLRAEDEVRLVLNFLERHPSVVSLEILDASRQPIRPTQMVYELAGQPA